MALNDKSVITAAVGYVFTAPLGTAAPTPAQIDTVDPAVFGAQVQTLRLTGTATSGTFTISDGAKASDPLPYNASAAQVQAAVEALSRVGAGNAVASGAGLTSGISVAIVGSLQGTALPPLVVDDTNLVGTSPKLAWTVTTAPNGWRSIGHTSREDMPEFGYDGGDTETKGTWQHAQLREVITKQAADFLKLNLHQFDAESFTLYFGANAASTPGVFGVSGDTAITERAFLVIIVDGQTRVGFYAPKASVRRDAAIKMPVDNFAALPVRATFLKHGANNLYQWISSDLFT